MDNRALDAARSLDKMVDTVTERRDKALEKLVGREAICTKGSKNGYWVKITGFIGGGRLRVQNIKSGKMSSVSLCQIRDLE